MSVALINGAYNLTIKDVLPNEPFEFEIVEDSDNLNQNTKQKVNTRSKKN